MLSTIYNFIIFYWITGFIVGQIFYIFTAKYNHIKWYEAFTYGVINLIIMCIGAKILYILENIQSVKLNGIEFSGFSLYGAIYIQVLSGYLISRIFKRKFWDTCDIIVIPFLIMLAFYRIDCFRNGCCCGITINGFVVPTQLIECLFCFALSFIYFIERYIIKQKKYNLFSIFFILYGAFRFIIEFVRERTNIFWLISISHILSICSILIGLILLHIYKQEEINDEENKKNS